MLKLDKILVLLGLLVLSSCSHEQAYSIYEEETVSGAPMENVWVDNRVSRSGLHYCPNNRRCVGTRLPPQPCEQPMPTYYDDLSEITVSEGVLLIHPMTRAKVLCFDQYGMSATDCAERFRSQGYVLITDIPQFAGKYDFLKEGSYPTRRWRKGEHIPRW